MKADETVDASTDDVLRTAGPGELRAHRLLAGRAGRAAHPAGREPGYLVRELPSALLHHACWVCARCKARHLGCGYARHRHGGMHVKTPPISNVSLRYPCLLGWVRVESPLTDVHRMLEVTGGSAATTASAADADFPALYKVRIHLCWRSLEG